MRNASIVRRLRRAALLGAAFVATGAMAGCSKTTTYSWVDVQVTIDPSIATKDLQSVVFGCEIKVTGADNVPGVSLPACMNGVNDHNLGTFEWSTTEGSGELQFTVTLFALNHEPFAVGTSEPITIVPGKRTTGSVLVLALETGGGNGGTSGNGGASGAAGTNGAAGRGGGTAGTAGSAGATGTAGTTGTAGNTGTAGTAGRGTAGTTGTAGRGGGGGATGMGGRGGSSGAGGLGAAGGMAGSAGGAGGA